MQTYEITALYKILLSINVILFACGCDSGDKIIVDHTITPRLQEMLTREFGNYRRDNTNLPEGAGIMMYVESADGSQMVSSGLPEGADGDWHYRIASISKTFTAAGIMLLDQQGKLDIDHVLTTIIPGDSKPYLPDSPDYQIPYKDSITIRNLLSHRAGIYDVFNNPIPETSSFPYAGMYYNEYVYTELNDPDHQFTADELAGLLSHDNLYTNPPDTEYEYTDTGYTLLAKIIEEVAGVTYEQFLVDNFFAPLGLKQTTAPWRGDDIILPVPYFHGFSSIGEDFFDTTEDNMSSTVGPGNIISTPADIAHWLRMILSGRGGLSESQIEKMAAVPEGNTSYALGISNSALGMGHTGAHPGYVNIAFYRPDDDVAIVLVTPFIDYSHVEDHFNMLLDVYQKALEIMGYVEE